MHAGGPVTESCYFFFAALGAERREKAAGFGLPAASSSSAACAAAIRLRRSFGGTRARDGDAERRAAHVAEADAMAELHGVRVATVFAADA